MSKLLQNVQQYRMLGNDRLMPSRPMLIPFAEADARPNGHDNLTIDRSTGYTLRAAVGIDFWANQAQYSDARRNAVKRLVAAMYSEVFEAIDHIHALLYAADIEGAHKRLDELSNELLEGQDL